MVKKISQFNLWLILCFFAAIAPAILLGNAVLNYSVDLIFADEWSIGLGFIHLLQGKPIFEELIAQQNDSRLFFPKLLFFGLAALNNFQYNTFNNCILIFLVACFISINIFVLSRLTLPLRFWQQFLLFAITPVKKGGLMLPRSLAPQTIGVNALGGK